MDVACSSIILSLCAPLHQPMKGGESIQYSEIKIYNSKVASSIGLGKKILLLFVLKLAGDIKTENVLWEVEIAE